jgi:hypothetical protein
VTTFAKKLGGLFWGISTQGRSVGVYMLQLVIAVGASVSVKMLLATQKCIPNSKHRRQSASFCDFCVYIGPKLFSKKQSNFVLLLQFAQPRN